MLLISSAARSTSFNPRARVGRDVSWISSHRFRLHGFNPRARVGRDVGAAKHERYSQRFNPRARVGRDLTAIRRYDPGYGFNPRARVGRDDDEIDDSFDCIVSIHAPAWGATSSTLVLLVSSRSFNPRARVGRDCRLQIW